MPPDHPKMCEVHEKLEDPFSRDYILKKALLKKPSHWSQLDKDFN